MMLATDYPFLEIVWTILVFFAFVVWIWLIFTVLGDIFRRSDSSGLGKVAWIIFIIVLPYLGVFVYLISQHDGMTKRAIAQQERVTGEVDEYVRSVGGSADPTEKIAKAKELLDRGAINQAEYEQIKQAALPG
jgi:hypothetical protein